MGGRTIIRGGMIGRDGGGGNGVEVRVRGGENGGMMMGIEMTKGEGGEVIQVMMNGRNGGIRVDGGQDTLSRMTNAGDHGANARERTSRTMNGDIVIKNVTRKRGNIERDIIDGETTQMTTPVNVGENTNQLRNVRNETEILPPATKAIDIENIPIADVTHLPRPLPDHDLTHHPENLNSRTRIPAYLPIQSALISLPKAPNLSVPKAAVE
jgi:hypothetical protein